MVIFATLMPTLNGLLHDICVFKSCNSRKLEVNIYDTRNWIYQRFEMSEYEMKILSKIFLKALKRWVMCEGARQQEALDDVREGTLGGF